LTSVDLKAVREAQQRIEGIIRCTPVLTSRLLNDITGASLFFKCENFQKTGAFKFRGATNAVLSLTEEERLKGVATHSSGNHGASLARAAQLIGTRAYIVMPDNAPRVKQEAVRDYGGIIHSCNSTLDARETTLDQVIEKHGCVFIPPYDDNRIIAGQGTVALEISRQVPNTDVVITPVGGGGLLAGVALATRALSDPISIYGAEPAGADDAYRSFKSGVRVTEHVPDTIADGLLTTLGELNFEIIQKSVDDILCVAEETIVEAMRLIWTRMKLIVEPSAAVPLAAVLENKALFFGRRVAIVLSGGNVDLDKLPWSMDPR
jgi:threonine dehydratase